MAVLREQYMESDVCGRCMTYPKAEADKEGGLRTQGIYKTDTDEQPLVTYITVVYNRADTIERCMKSIWAQTYQNVEYILVDGASDDGTLQLIEDNADKIDYYISQPDSGIYSAMNKGIALARGRFLCFMNSDDECVPDAAQKVIDEYRKTEADIICGIRDLYVKNQYTEETTYPRYCIKHCNFRYIQMYHQATYASYEVFNKIGGFDEDYSLLADYIWESAAIDAGAKVHFCNEVLTKFNYDGASFKGIVKRDDEWVEWTMRSFPELTKTDAELFIYSLDRGRHPMFDLATLDKVAFHYMNDKKFKKAYYETVLLACVEACIDIDALLETVEMNVDPIFFKYNVLRDIPVKKYADLRTWLEEQLKESIDKDEEQFEAEQAVFNRLERIRRFQVDAFCKLYAKKSFGFRYGLSLNAIGRNSYYAASRHAGKSIELSRKFYPGIRAQWKLD